MLPWLVAKDDVEGVLNPKARKAQRGSASADREGLKDNDWKHECEERVVTRSIHAYYRLYTRHDGCLTSLTSLFALVIDSTRSLRGRVLSGQSERLG